MPEQHPLDPELLFRTLAAHEVRFVLAANRPQDRQDVVIIKEMIARRG